ncbi:MAG TPA: metallophosphoesterase [Novosphingobium sp.]|nr:metallophosphoesterase [Novosphingobium sp.]HQA18591.1 metallophosphoesterase [Novosphingobium sp.]
MRRLLKLAIKAAALAVLSVSALIAYGLVEAHSDPIRREADIIVPSFPAAQAPFRVALLSDIHFGNRAMQRERLEAIVAAINAAHPDLIVITGDFVNGHRGKLRTNPADLVEPLAGLQAPQGVIATPGNHDHWTDLAKIQAALERAGITVIANQAVQRGPLLILGIDDAYSGHADVAAALAATKGLSGVPVAITHSPDITPRLPAEIGTVLAGHTHCGQVVLPMIGSLAPLFGYHVFDPHYQCGVVADAGRTVVVTAGLGSGSIPVRVGAPPDWWLISFSAPKDR